MTLPTRNPWRDEAWFLALFATVVAGTCAGHVLWTLPLWPLLFHGGHELLHLSLFRRRRGMGPGRIATEVVGAATFAIFGQNYFLVRSAHLEHHRIGRREMKRGLLDRPAGRSSALEVATYYASLLGKNYWGYVVAGPIFLLSPRIYQRCFHRVGLRRTVAVLAAQTVVVSWWTFNLLGPHAIGFALAQVVFSAYWGLSQNVAHYGLALGGARAKYAARTYEVPRWVHFAFFGSVFRHTEHHVFPHVAGSLTDEPSLRNAAASMLACDWPPPRGAIQYLYDLLDQFRGPNPAPRVDWCQPRAE